MVLVPPHRNYLANEMFASKGRQHYSPMVDETATDGKTTGGLTPSPGLPEAGIQRP